MTITTDGEVFSKELTTPSYIARNCLPWGGVRPEMEIIGKYTSPPACSSSVPSEPLVRHKPKGVHRKKKYGLNLLTVKEAAKALHATIPVSAIYRAINNGSLLATSIGRRYYITIEALEKFIGCPDQKNQPDFGSVAMMARGSSSIKDAKSGQAMAEASARKLRKRSLNT